MTDRLDLDNQIYKNFAGAGGGITEGETPVMEKSKLVEQLRQVIEEILDRLPRSYIPDLYRHKCDVVYQHIYYSYFGQGLSIYSHATK